MKLANRRSRFALFSLFPSVKLNSAFQFNSRQQREQRQTEKELGFQLPEIQIFPPPSPLSLLPPVESYGPGPNSSPLLIKLLLKLE